MPDQLDLSKELIDRRALVTGSVRGIGAAIAPRLLDAGAKMVTDAPTPNNDTPASAMFIAGDVTTNEGVETIATKAVAALVGLGPTYPQVSSSLLPYNFNEGCMT